MKPEEKAIELENKFYGLVRTSLTEVSRHSKNDVSDYAKACAIICVDEIIKECSPYLKNTLNYWQSVKTFLQSK